MKIHPEDVVIRVVQLPERVEGFIHSSCEGDGKILIYVNESLTFERRREVLKHEMEHVQRDDFDEGLEA